MSAVGFAAFRGCLDVTTPLAVSTASNAVNAVLDPLLIFKARIGLGGAAITTAISEACACAAYLVLLPRRRLLTWRRRCRVRQDVFALAGDSDGAEEWSTQPAVDALMMGAILLLFMVAFTYFYALERDQALAGAHARVPLAPPDGK